LLLHEIIDIPFGITSIPYRISIIPRGMIFIPLGIVHIPECRKPLKVALGAGDENIWNGEELLRRGGRGGRIGGGEKVSVVYSKNTSPKMDQWA
jgi:hypothetical protein